MAQTEADASAPAYIPLGNGLCRLNLRSPGVRLLPPEKKEESEYEATLRFAVSPLSAADDDCVRPAPGLECLINPPLEEGF